MSSLTTLIVSFGYIGIFTIIFAESGFLLGFFLPGDSLLVTAGLLAVKGYFSFPLLLLLVIVGAILGDSLGYMTGNKFGPKIFNKEDSLFFKKKYVRQTEDFFKKYGTKAIILARFVPIVRTFTPIMAGVGSMKYKTFLAYNIVGGILWGGGLLIASYFAGVYIPGFEKYIEYVVIGIIVLSVLPIVWQFFQKDK